MLLLGLPWRAAGCLLARMDGWRGGIEWTGSLCFELGCRGVFKVGMLILLRIFEGWAWKVGVALEDAMDRGESTGLHHFELFVCQHGSCFGYGGSITGRSCRRRGFLFSCRVAVLLHF